MTKSRAKSNGAGAKGSRSQSAKRTPSKSRKKRTPSKSRERREFLGPKLGAGHREGEIGDGFSVQKILNDPRLSSLGFDVLDQLKEQFSEDGSYESLNETSGAGPDGVASHGDLTVYREKLQFWAQMLETLLEETLDELDRLDR